MDKLRMESPDLVQGNVEKIAALFPNCVTEGPDGHGGLKRAIDFNKLRQMLSGDVLEGDEAYEFTWVGKKAAMVEANKPTRQTLRPCPEESKNWDTTENLYIEGDNLQVLKLLQESYLGKVKMIYIDPPYNTGHDFIYNDHFAMDKDEYEQQTSMYDEDGNRNFIENTDSNPRFHSDWCSMMYSRLMLARNLLTEDGVIVISIDDIEQTNVRKICDEVFGCENFVSQFIWHSRQNKDNRNISGVSIDHEYLICYSKTTNQRLFYGTERKTEQYTNPDNDPRGPWTSANMVGLATADARPNLHYDLVNPETGVNYGCPAKGWRYDKDTMKKLISDGRIIWPESPTGRPRKKAFLYELSDNLPGFSSVITDGIYTNTATKELANLFDGRHYFDFPKPSLLLQQFVGQITKGNDIILDFFSGSASTAHAVIAQNFQDVYNGKRGNRKFIMVQLPEKCKENSELYRAGYTTICDIGKERIRRAGEYEYRDIRSTMGNTMRWNEEERKRQGSAYICPEDVDIGFRVFKLDDSNMRDVYFAPDDYTQDMLSMMESNIKPDRTALDLLFGCLLEWGLPLSMPYRSETIDGCTVHTYNDGDLIACFDEKIPATVIEAIARRKPLRAVFRDAGFTTSPEKINLTEIFKLLAPDTRVKVI